MTGTEDLFIELTQVALGNRPSLSKAPSEKEWSTMLAIAKKQAVAGFVFDALDRLLAVRQTLPKHLMFKWLGAAEQIKRQNLIVNEKCKEVTKLFADAGFESYVLKGQGNALMYPNPLSRTSGDIDLWVYDLKGKKEDGRCLREQITAFVKKRTPDVFEQYHHIDFPIFRNVPVEVHYTPGRLLSAKYNRRFQAWCEQQKDGLSNIEVNTGGFYVPSIAFNAVYQMVHIMTHFFVEGIGMRHFVDYYYVLKHFDGTGQKEEVSETFRWLGLGKFARGVMWIEKEILGIDERCLIVEPNERFGRLILNEMMEGGNFGQHDKRYSFRSKGYLARGIVDSYRLLKLAYYFPHDALWKIVRKVENQKWKVKK